MTISARLSPRMHSALARYCRRVGITKTAAIERGLQLLLAEVPEERHAAFATFERLRDHLPEGIPQDDSAAALKQHLDEKYPG